MTNNKHSSNSLSIPIKFKHYSNRQKEKKSILKLCKRKLKDLQNKDFFSPRTILIKNTLKIIEKQQTSVESEDEDEDSPSYIESLLNEIDLDQTKQSEALISPVPNLHEGAALNSRRFSDVLNEFHNCETLSHNSLVFKEDLGQLFEQSCQFYDFVKIGSGSDYMSP